MVVLRMAGATGDLDDYEVESSWLELARSQADRTEPITLSSLEEGDCLAMWDRNNFTEEWPGREVFVLMDSDSVLVFDAGGQIVDEPESFVPAGRQPMRGDNSFTQEWASCNDYTTTVSRLWR